MAATAATTEPSDENPKLSPNTERTAPPDDASNADRALFQGVQERDPDAWARFIDRFGPVVRAAAYRAGLKADALEDAEQATWMVLLRHAPLIREPNSLPRWVVTTATREAWRRARRDQGRRDAESLHREDLERDAEAGDLATGAIRLELVQEVRDGIQALDGRCSKLLQALFLDPGSPSYEELADDLGLQVGSIGPTRQRCLSRLAELLARRGVSIEED